MWGVLIFFSNNIKALKKVQIPLLKNKIQTPGQETECYLHLGPDLCSRISSEHNFLHFYKHRAWNPELQAKPRAVSLEETDIEEMIFYLIESQPLIL